MASAFSGKADAISEQYASAPLFWKTLFWRSTHPRDNKGLKAIHTLIHTGVAASWKLAAKFLRALRVGIAEVGVVGQVGGQLNKLIDRYLGPYAQYCSVIVQTYNGGIVLGNNQGFVGAFPNILCY